MYLDISNYSKYRTLCKFIENTEYNIIFNVIFFQISLAIAKALGTTPELGLGLFYIACVPGGGLGHVMVSITGGDRALSVAINCVTTIATIGECVCVWGGSVMVSITGGDRALSVAINCVTTIATIGECVCVWGGGGECVGEEGGGGGA